MNTTKGIDSGNESYYQTSVNYVKTAVKFDSTLDDNMIPVLYLLSWIPDQVPGKESTINKVKDIAGWVGNLDYLSKLHSVVTLKVLDESKLGASAVICKVIGKTGSLLTVIPPLLTTHPMALTITKVSGIACEFLQGASLGFVVADIGSQAYAEPENRTWGSFLTMVGLSSLTYILVAPIFMNAAPFIAIAGSVTDITLTAAFVIQIYDAVSDRVGAYVKSKFNLKLDLSFAIV